MAEGVIGRATDGLLVLGSAVIENVEPEHKTDARAQSAFAHDACSGLKSRRNACWSTLVFCMEVVLSSLLAFFPVVMDCASLGCRKLKETL